MNIADILGQMTTTKLSPVLEAVYQQEKKTNGFNDDDYDMRGYFQEFGSTNPLLSSDSIYNNGHYTDKYKKPNHPTFSIYSQYNNTLTPDGFAQGGKWEKENDGSWSYYASPYNLTQYSPDELQNYFNVAEQGNKLILPTAYRNIITQYTQK